MWKMLFAERGWKVFPMENCIGLSCKFWCLIVKYSGSVGGLGNCNKGCSEPCSTLDNACNKPFPV